MASKKPFLRKENSKKGWVMPNYIWRKLRERFNSEHLQTSVKHTISPVVVLGSASGGGGNVIKIDGKMNTGSSEKYHQTTTLPMQCRKFLERKTHTVEQYQSWNGLPKVQISSVTFWDHLDREWNEMHPTFNMSFDSPSRSL